MWIGGFSRRIDRQFGGDRLAHDDGAGLSQKRDGRGIKGRGAARMQHCPILGRHVLGVEDILDADRDAVQRAQRGPTAPVKVGIARLLQRILRIKMYPGTY